MGGAMCAVLKDALRPNIVQTLEKNIAIIHCGPFANIAHGCNSFMATKAGLKLGEYAVTEAGFGADLGAEKFLDIKCRLTGLKPQCACLVASVKALKHHGGAEAKEYKVEGLEKLEKGFVNLDRHILNIRQNYNLPVVVSLNHFYHDTDAEIAAVQKHLAGMDVPHVVAKHWADGGKGAEDLAKAVVAAAEAQASPHTFVYPAEDSLWQKIEAIATKIYSAKGIDSSAGVKKKLERWSKEFPGMPVCIAKTQSSFSTDASKRGAPEGHLMEIREVSINCGAGFVVAVCGDVMTMPGLPKEPSSEKIDVLDDGTITGLF